MKMKLNVLEEGERKLKILVEESSPAFMNALRRISINNVPVLAIEDVIVDENDSALFDEVVAQRLGQIPLVFDPEEFNFRDECDCEDGCPNCEAKFSLEKEGPGKVYSGDLVCETGDVETLYNEIPITHLDENQKVKMEAVAILSTGQDHSKHQAAITSYRYYPKIQVDNRKISKEDVEKCVEVCPKDVFEDEDGKLKVKNEENCTLCKECLEEIDSDGLEIEGDESRFILNIESVSSLSPWDIMEESMGILERKAEKVVEKIG